MIINSNSLSRGSGMPYQVDDTIPHAMSGTELSRVRTELRLLLREHINQRLLASSAADIVMQSSGIDDRHLYGKRVYQDPSVGSDNRRTINFAKSQTTSPSARRYKYNGVLRVTEFAPVAFPFSFQLR